MTLTTDAQRGSDFAALSRQVRDAQLLERRRGHYTARIALTLGAYVAAWTAFALIGSSWWQLLTAVVLGALFTQVAFLGHDGGHQQIARSRRVNHVLGVVVGDLLVGLSFGWWVLKHNRHHAKPNHEGHDPDIAGAALAFSARQAEERTDAFGRFMARYQAWLFFPMLTLEGLQLHVASTKSLLTGGPRRYRSTELALMGLHFLGYLGGVFWVLSPLQALAFIAVHQAVFGVYMGCSFAPNHKGMPIIGEGEELDFLRRQVLTSRNVAGGVFTDVLLGGLNYQVEHHLFPNMPRPNLRRAQPIVREYCRQHRILYTETSLIGSYVAALRHLNSFRPAAPVPARAAR